MPQSAALSKSGGPALLAAQGLSRRYGQHQALWALDLELHAGQVMGLLGPNGAGKSTTLELLSGNLQPHTGSIHINGFDLAREPLAARRQLGYLPDSPPLYPELRVDEYLRMCATLQGLGRDERTRALSRVKRQCHLDEVGRQLISRLSRGYQQRVGLAQALIHQPRLLILDEPTVGLDPIQIREIRDLIRTLSEQCSIILSTHILPEVQALCSHVTVLNRGRMVYTGALNEFAGGEGRAWQLVLRRPPARKALEALPGISQVGEQGNGHFIFQGEELAIQGLVGASVDGDWGLVELSPRGTTLEDLFMQVTEAQT